MSAVNQTFECMEQTLLQLAIVVADEPAATYAVIILVGELECAKCSSKLIGMLVHWIACTYAINTVSLTYV